MTERLTDEQVREMRDANVPFAGDEASHEADIVKVCDELFALRSSQPTSGPFRDAIGAVPMTDPIEARLLALAEKATMDYPAFARGRDELLRPSTVSRLVRVVAENRAFHDQHHGDMMGGPRVMRPITLAECSDPRCRIVAALDAEQGGEASR